MQQITFEKIPEYNKPLGKLGNYVYYWNNGTYCKRLYVKPVQPGTLNQRKWWRRFEKCVRQYQGLNPVQKAEYERKAKPWKMSGFNYYIHEQITL